MFTLRRSHLLAALLLATTLALPPAPARAAVLLQDFFTDDVAAAAPNNPEIGSAFYGSGANVTHTVIDAGGNLKQQIVSAGPAGSPSNGSSLEYFPTSQPQRARVSYEYRIASAGLDQVGRNAHLQELIFDPLGLNLFLLWSSPADNRHLYLGITRPGDQTITTTDTSVTYSPDTTYVVEWLIDTLADRFSLALNGNPLATDAAFGADGDSLRELVFQNNFNTLGTQIIDTVLIDSVNTVPEPSSLALLTIAFIALGIAIRLSA